MVSSAGEYTGDMALHLLLETILHHLTYLSKLKFPIIWWSLLYLTLII